MIEFSTAIFYFYKMKYRLCNVYSFGNTSKHSTTQSRQLYKLSLQGAESKIVFTQIHILTTLITRAFVQYVKFGNTVESFRYCVAIV